MKHLTLIAALCFATPVSAVLADDMTSSKTQKLADADLQVAGDIHAVNKHEVEMANMALKQGTKAVKTYADTMIREHTSNDKDLMALAKRHNATLPTPKPDPDDQATMHKLMGLKGTDFDRAYIDAMVDGHTKVQGKLQNAMSGISNSDLRAHVETTKTAVDRHLDMAKQLQSAAPTAQK